MRKIKGLFCLLLIAVLLISVAPVVGLAAMVAEIDAANKLYALGLFKGTGIDESGKPIYSLERSLTRAEGVALLVRFLGKESDANAADTSELPFSDVATWAKPYVAYAYGSGLTNGVSAERFGGSSEMTAVQYLTFLLRALGYKDGVDFSWSKAYELTDKLGFTNGQIDSGHNTLTRGDAVKVSVNALYQTVQGEDKTLLKKLLDEKAVTEKAIEEAGLKGALVVGASPGESDWIDEISISIPGSEATITLTDVFSRYVYYESGETGSEEDLYVFMLGDDGTITMDDDYSFYTYGEDDLLRLEAKLVKNTTYALSYFGIIKFQGSGCSVAIINYFQADEEIQSVATQKISDIKAASGPKAGIVTEPQIIAYAYSEAMVKSCIDGGLEKIIYVSGIYAELGGFESLTIPDGVDVEIYYTLDVTGTLKVDGSLSGGALYLYEGSTNNLGLKSGNWYEWDGSKYVLGGEIEEEDNKASDSTTSAGELEALAEKVFELTNAERAKEGLSPLKHDSKLSAAAMLRAEELVESFSHTRPDGRECWTAWTEVGVTHSPSGENIAAWYTTPEKVVAGWMNSEGHRANILAKSSQYLGVGVAVDSDGRLYWTQCFSY